MFYRQSELLVSQMRRGSPARFRVLMEGLYAGEPLASAFEVAYADARVQKEIAIGPHRAARPALCRQHFLRRDARSGLAVTVTAFAVPRRGAWPG